MEDIWYLTSVVNGRVQLTTIMAASFKDAVNNAYDELFRRTGEQMNIRPLADANGNAETACSFSIDDAIIGTLLKCN